MGKERYICSFFCQVIWAWEWDPAQFAMMIVITLLIFYCTDRKGRIFHFIYKECDVETEDGRTEKEEFGY